jgi:hypothetical protein
MTPKEDLWRSEDYDDEPRSNGNFGLDPLQQECKLAGEDARKPRFEVPDYYARNMREAEASSRLEGIDTSDNVLGNSLKAQILAGEISVDEACAFYVDHIRASLA